jgi:NAD(P)-dependent dehydrogenase (short-subunit alcohol dehydrogenase family)
MDKRALITGASGALGTVVVKKMKEAGFKVVAVVSPDDKDEKQTGDIESYAIDVVDETSVNEAMNKIVKHESPIDMAVLAVGGFEMDTLTDLSLSKIREMISLNFESAFNFASQLVRVMKKQPNGGRIILIGGRPGLEPEKGDQTVSYALSKSLLVPLARIINTEGKKHDVKAHVIVPSIIDTKANREAMPDADFTKWVPAEDIAETILFLSDESGKKVDQEVIKIYNKS